MAAVYAQLAVEIGLKALGRRSETVATLLSEGRQQKRP